MYQADALLAQRLGEELQYEKEAVAGSQADEPKFLKDFKEQGIWTVSLLFRFLFAVDQ
jgi:complement component 1 Q subcomponent-binding protein